MQNNEQLSRQWSKYLIQLSRDESFPATDCTAVDKLILTGRILAKETQNAYKVYKKPS